MLHVIATAEVSPAKASLGRILIVDDDRSVADTFSRLLTLEGFEVATALDPGLGLELADTIAPSAIILDLRMPLISGLQFLRSIRAKPHLAQTPVAIVTGDYFLSDALQEEVASLGATLRFKPMWVEDLVALARTLAPR
jgi:DNA-binding response OmpR family regulator